MTVNDLIIELQKLPKDLIVICRGYEGGYDDITNPEEITVAEYNKNDDGTKREWYFGKYYEVYEDLSSRYKNYTSIKAVKL